VGSIGAPELIVVFIVALLVLGPDRLPKAARQVGKAMSEFRRISGGFQDEVRRAMDSDDTDDSTERSDRGETDDADQSSSTVPPPRADTSPGPAAATRPLRPTEAELPPPPDDPSFN
jgi:Tat protein translocase TatB subunit